MLAAAALVTTVLPATAGAFDPTTDRETHLLSRSINGGFPNGPSRNAVFAQNGQGASYVAFESDASDLVTGDSNGFTDVFVLRRGGKYTDSGGEPWQPSGAPQIASRGMAGAPANGNSYGPDLDGDATHRKPHCVAFVSDASNLVPRDTNGKPDAFIRDLRTQRIKRVSLGNRGAQSNGSTYDVKIDGSCSRVAFTSDASNLYLSAKAARGKFKRPLRTKAPQLGTKQVYVRFLTGTKDNKKLKGVTFLASSSKRGKPGAGNSYDVSFGRQGDGCPKHCGTTMGDSVAFTSDASNLAGRDGNGKPDVYQKTFHAPTINTVQRRRGKKRIMNMNTLLISSTRSGRSGNGASSNPAANDDGEFVAFQTDATNLVAGDHNGATDILLRGTFPGAPRMKMVSHALETGQANAGSYNPTITSPASILFFESDASNLQPNPVNKRAGGKFYDRNCMRDIFFWSAGSGNASLQSRDSLQRIPNLPENTGGGTEAPCPATIASGSSHAASSYYGNYFVFESSYPLLDLDFENSLSDVDGLLPSIVANPIAKWARAAQLSHDDPAMHQVYLRYNGPQSRDSHFPNSVWPKP
jgi:hypothetical protein